MGRARWRWASLAVVALLIPTLAQAERRAQRRLLRSGASAATTPTPPPAAPELAVAVERLRAALGPDGESARPPGEAGDGDGYLLRTNRGHVRALSAPAGRTYVPSRASAAAKPESLALSFLREHRMAFGLSRPGVTLHPNPVRTDRGRRFVRFEQRFAGLAVFGAAAIVQVEPSGGVSFVLADLAADDARLHGPDFVTRPAVSAEDAAGRARALVPPESQTAALAEASPVLMVYEPSVIGNAGPSQLVWHVRLRNEEVLFDEIVLVDASNGAIAFRYSNAKQAKNRSIFDHANVAGSAGTLVRSEGQPASGLADADQAYDFLGDAYEFYLTRFGRDSYDGAGAPIVARVRYCQSAPSCPMADAFWSGTDVRVGQGFAVDDVVAHELTHGVTEREANLIYWNESGAINEALSDIFGEYTDLTNTGGTDTPAVRWNVGEDLPGGAIRSMSNPPLFGDPDRRFSPNWFTGEADNRGVHINSGVANKLAFLLTDGGSFNGHTVAAQGLEQTAQLFYQAQANLLVPASDYIDLYVALRQAAINVGWDGTRQAALEAGSRAVEIAIPGATSQIFSDDFEGPFPGSWQIFDDSLPPKVGAEWGRSSFRKAGGSFSAYCAAGGPAPAPPGGPYKSDMFTWMIVGPFSLATAQDAWAEFDVFIDVEPGFLDDIFWGVTTDDPTGPGTVFFDGFAVQPFPTGKTPGFVHEVFNFKDVPGIVGQPQVWLGFNFASDEIIESEGVYIDNVMIRQAIAQNTNLSVTKTNSLSAVAPGQSVTYTIVVSNGGPDAVVNARVVDNLPAVLLSPSWTCAASGGSSCAAASGTGSLDRTVSLAASGTATFVITSVLSPTATGTLVNTATVTLPNGFLDSVPGDNSATDSDPILPAASLSIGDVPKTEGNTGTSPANFTVTLSPSSTATVTVSYTTVPGSATRGVDYTSTTGLLTFLPGETSQPIAVPVAGDVAAEPDETFFVTLQSPSNATLADGGGVGTIVDDDGGGGPGAGPPGEVIHGFERVGTLAALPGPAAREQVFLVDQKPYSSYEAVIDEISGDVQPLEVDRLAGDGTTVLQSAQATSAVGASLSLRWRNAGGSSVSDQTVRIRSGGCGTDCGADDTYRVRFYETTASIPRFNNSGTQVTVLVLQNPTDDTISGTVYFWSPAGALLGMSAFSLTGRQTLILNTAGVAGAGGQSGAITIAHDGPFGALSGKAVALEAATGFSFDSPMVWRATR